MAMGAQILNTQEQSIRMLWPKQKWGVESPPFRPEIYRMSAWAGLTSRIVASLALRTSKNFSFLFMLMARSIGITSALDCTSTQSFSPMLPSAIARSGILPDPTSNRYLHSALCQQACR